MAKIFFWNLLFPLMLCSSVVNSSECVDTIYGGFGFEEERNFNVICYNVTSDLTLNFDNASVTSVEELTISEESKVPVVPSKSSLTSFTSLKALNLRSLEIEKLIPGAFNVLKKLEKLDLTSNRLEQILPGTFDNLSALTELFLGENVLTTITGNVFNNLKSLEILELSRNLINHIDEDSFLELEELKMLDLMTNNITELKGDLLRKNTKLNSLTLSENPLRNLHKFCFNPTIINIDIEYTDLKHFDLDLSKLVHLEILDLSGSHLEEMDFANLPKIENINLGHNRINMLKNFALAKAETLKLNHNRITKIKEFPCEVSYLNLDNNKIQQVEPFSLDDNCSKIVELDLSGNEIEIASCYGMSQLKNLFLRDNNIILIKSDSFVNCQRLRVLDLRNNKIKSVEKSAFQDTKSLRAIQLSNNYLETLHHDAFLDLNELDHLEVRNNKIVYIDLDKIRENASNLRWIALRNNSFSCQNSNVIFEKLRKHKMRSDIYYVNYKKCELVSY